MNKLSRHIYKYLSIYTPLGFVLSAVPGSSSRGTHRSRPGLRDGSVEGGPLLRFSVELAVSAAEGFPHLLHAEGAHGRRSRGAVGPVRRQNNSADARVSPSALLNAELFAARPPPFFYIGTGVLTTER